MSGMLSSNILECIGDTTMLELRTIRASNGSRIVLKLEGENPTGSMKDRMALAMIRAPEEDGRLREGGPVVEYTGGSTGVSLALVCVVRRHPLQIVTSDAFSPEKLDHMRILGAELHVIRSDDGRMTERLTRDMIGAARVLAERTGAFWTDQMRNLDQLVAYRGMAQEIWQQTSGQVDAFVQSVGTAASFRGIGEELRQLRADVHLVAVEPAESPVLSGGRSGAHHIDGIGAGYIVPMWKRELADGIERVSTDDALAMARRLARDEGVFGGTSTGANVVAALRVAEGLGPGRTVVSIMCDTGMKYLKTFGRSLRAGADDNDADR